MKFILLFCLFFCISCSSKDAAIKKDWQAFSDSLFSSIAPLRLPSLEWGTIEKNQIRFLEGHASPRRLPITLKDDSVSIIYKSSAVLLSDTVEMKKILNPGSENGFIPNDELNVMLSIKPSTPMKNVVALLDLLLIEDYIDVVFTGKVTLPPPPSIPDSARYNKIIKKMNSNSKEIAMQELVKVMSKEFKKHPDISELVNEAANAGGGYESSRIYCNRFPELVEHKASANKLFTILYIGIEFDRNWNKMQGSGRGFKLSNAGKRITVPFNSIWEDFFPILLNETAEKIVLVLQQESKDDDL